MPLPVRTEHLLAAILSSTEDAVLSFSLDGTVQTWSPGAQRLYGYAESEIAGQALARLLPTGDASAFEGILRAAISGNFPHHETSPRLSKDGAQTLVRLTHTPVRDDHGHIIAIVENGASVASSSVESADEMHLKLLIDQMPMVVWTTDKDLRITSCLGARLRGVNSQRRAARQIRLRIPEMPGPAHDTGRAALRSFARCVVAIRVQTQQPHLRVTP